MLSILPLLFTKISLLPQIKKQNTKHPPFSNSHCFCLARRTLHYLIVNPKLKTPGTSKTLLHIEYYHIFLVFPFFFFFYFTDVSFKVVGLFLNSNFSQKRCYKCLQRVPEHNHFQYNSANVIYKILHYLGSFISCLPVLDSSLVNK